MRHKISIGGELWLLDRIRAVPHFPRPTVGFGPGRKCEHPKLPKKAAPEFHELAANGICWKCRGSGWLEQMTAGYDPEVFYTIRRHSNKTFVVVNAWAEPLTEPLSWDKVLEALAQIRNET